MSCTIQMQCEAVNKAGCDSQDYNVHVCIKSLYALLRTTTYRCIVFITLPL